MTPSALLGLGVIGFLAPLPLHGSPSATPTLPMAPSPILTPQRAAAPPLMQEGSLSAVPELPLTLWPTSLVDALPAGMAALSLAAAVVLFRGFRSLSFVAAAYATYAKTSPLLCAVTTSTIKGICSDLFAQLVVERKRRLHWKRTIAFCLFGAVYLGAYCHLKYVFLYDFLFGSAKSGAVILKKVACDLLVSAPLIYYPTYFAFKGALFGSVRDEIKNYFSSKGAGMVFKYWAVWTPTFITMWTVVPLHLRLPFICAVSLVWQVVLSVLTYMTPATDQPPVEPVASPVAERAARVAVLGLEAGPPPSYAAMMARPDLDLVMSEHLEHHPPHQRRHARHGIVRTAGLVNYQISPR